MDQFFADATLFAILQPGPQPKERFYWQAARVHGKGRHSSARQTAGVTYNVLYPATPDTVGPWSFR